MPREKKRTWTYLALVAVGTVFALSAIFILNRNGNNTNNTGAIDQTTTTSTTTSSTTSTTTTSTTQPTTTSTTTTTTTSTTQPPTTTTQPTTTSTTTTTTTSTTQPPTTTTQPTTTSTTTTTTTSTTQPPTTTTQPTTTSTTTTTTTSTTQPPTTTTQPTTTSTTTTTTTSTTQPPTTTEPNNQTTTTELGKGMEQTTTTTSTATCSTSENSSDNHQGGSRVILSSFAFTLGGFAFTLPDLPELISMADAILIGEVGKTLACEYHMRSQRGELGYPERVVFKEITTVEVLKGTVPDRFPLLGIDVEYYADINLTPIKEGEVILFFISIEEGDPNYARSYDTFYEPLGESGVFDVEGNHAFPRQPVGFRDDNEPYYNRTNPSRPFIELDKFREVFAATDK